MYIASLTVRLPTLVCLHLGIHNMICFNTGGGCSEMLQNNNIFRFRASCKDTAGEMLGVKAGSLEFSISCQHAKCHNYVAFNWWKILFK